MTIDKLKPGMTVYEVHSYKMGNTTRRSIGVWEVRIVSVDSEKGIVVASWNGNPASKYFKSSWSKWRLKEPMLVKSGWGHRLATREEQKATLIDRRCASG